MKTLTLKYVTRTKTGSYEYRRQVPLALREALGRYEFKKVLGLTEFEAIKAWPRYHDQVQRELTRATKKAGPTIEAVRTALDDYREAYEKVLELGIDPERPIFNEPDGDPDSFAREALIDRIAGKYPIDDDGHAEISSLVDTLMIRLISSGPATKKPLPTFEDAKRLYVTAKVEGDPKEKTKRQRYERVAGYIRTALGRDYTLDKLTRSHAREVIAHMLSLGLSPETVDRYANDIRAVINFGVTEFELQGVANPFMKIEIKGLKFDGKVDRDERSPFTPKQLKETRQFILSHAGTDLRLIWRLLQGTGCRLA
jgi:hypothetical protein